MGKKANYYNHISEDDSHDLESYSSGRSPKDPLYCKHCYSVKVFWSLIGDKWKLFDTGSETPHVCDTFADVSSPT